MEGIAGVKDLSHGYDSATIAPRWESGGIQKADVIVKYEASGGYVAYGYQYIQDHNVVILNLAGSGSSRHVDLLLPKGKTARSVHVNDSPVSYTERSIEQSRYATFDIQSLAYSEVRVALADG
jgi:hypothetical protein